MKFMLRGELVTETSAWVVPHGNIICDQIVLEEYDVVALSDKLEGFYAAEYFHNLSILFLPVPNIV